MLLSPFHAFISLCVCVCVCVCFVYDFYVLFMHSFPCVCVCVSGSVFLYYCSPVLKSLMAKVVSTLETTRAKHMSDLPSFYERALWLVSVLAQVGTGTFYNNHSSSSHLLFIIITVVAVISIVWSLINKGEHTALYIIDKCIHETSNI